MKRYWFTYVEHILRMYANHSREELTTQAEIRNFDAAEAVFFREKSNVGDMILYVYGQDEKQMEQYRHDWESYRNTRMREWGKVHGIPLGVCWAMHRIYITEVARERGLL